MKHVLTFLSWLVLFSGGLSFTQAQTRLFLPSPTLPHQPANQATTARSARQVTASTIRYVKAGASGTGASWSNASGDLQAMINASAAGDQVWIAGGTYKPSPSGLTNARTAAFSLKNGVSVLGGFSGTAGSEGNPSTRTAVPSSTTLSGDIGSVGDASDNCYHVVANSYNGLDNSAVLDGVVLTAGNANASSTDGTDAYGGGMLNASSSPSLLNCQISGNNSTVVGGLYNFQTTGTRVINCVFQQNTSGFTGAAADYASTNTVWANCFFEQNQNPGPFSAYAGSNSTVTLTNCTFRNNAGSVGFQNATLTLVNCLLWNNNGQAGVFRNGGTLNVSYSLLETGITYTDGGHNQTLSSSPFDNASGLALKACAPAIDAGNDAANSTTIDVLGNSRKVRAIDIGAAEFQGTPTQPVAITSQPPSASTVAVGTSLSVSVNLSGSVSTYQWVKDGQPVNGQRAATLTLTNLQSAQSGSYALVVTGACNSVTSTAFSLRVDAPPVITFSTGSTQTDNGLGVSFSVDPSLTLSDSDSPTLASANVRLSASFQPQQDRLFLLQFGSDDFGNITAAYTAATGELTLISAGATATLAQWQNALRAVTYQNTANTTPTPASRTVSFVVNDGLLSSATVTKTLLVNDRTPSATGLAASSPAVCVGSPVTFTATLTNLRDYSYTLTNGSSVSTGTVLGQPTTFSQTVTAAGSGLQSFTLTLVSFGRVFSATTPLTVGSSLPVASLASSGALSCATSSVSLTASGGITYLFSPGAVPAGTGNTATVSAGGLYSVTALASNGCSATASTSVSSNTTAPAVSISPSVTSICAGQTTMLTAQGADTYQWGPTLTTGSISVSATGTYSVTGTSASNGCSATATASVTVNPVPIVSITGLAGAYCQNATDRPLTGLPTGGVFTIDGTSTTTFSPASLSVGQHTVLYSYTNISGCSTTANQTVTINVVPIVSITGVANAYCKNASVVPLNGSPVGAVFTVDGSPTTTLNPASLSVGPHTVTYSFTNVSGCSGTKSQTVTINEAPTVRITGLVSAYCQSVTGFPLSGLPANGAFTVDGSSATTFDPASLSVGQHTVVYSVTNASGCSNVASQPVTINALPVVSITGLSSAYCKNATSVPLGGSPSDGVFTVDGNTGTSLNPASLSIGPHTIIYAYTNSSGCSSTASQTVTINDIPTVTITDLASAYCQDAGVVTLGGTPTGGQFTLDNNVVTRFNSATLALGQHTVVYSFTNASGCSSTTSQLFTLKPTPTAPSVVTASGYPYPAGVSSLTIAQNVGPVQLVASGCSGGMLTANGTAASSFTVSTAMTGTQTYTAACTQTGCTSPVASFLLTVVPTTLSVLHRDADYGNTQNNILKPYLELANAGGQPISYSDITVRYWFTAEGNAPPTNLAVYYAQLGAVAMNYVVLDQPRQGATGYVEYSFPGSGSLASNSNSGAIENGIQKTDGSNFDESDDYSYQANYADYVSNAHVTAYRNGTIVWGQEPTVVTSLTAVQVYSQTQDQTTTSQIQTRLELRNTGNVALPLANLKLRYYFTSDNGQTANVYVDYADIGASNVQASVVKLASPVNGADSYVELSFPGTTGQLGALSSLGAIDFRLVRSDYGLFDQSNDYSFLANYGNEGLNNRVTAYVNNTLLFGTPPSGAPARMIAVEPGSVLHAKVLGNPVVGPRAEIEITGAQGQAVQLRLVDLQGRSVHEQRIEQAGQTERVSLPLGQSSGQLLLKVSTNTQQQSLKLLRP